MTLTERISEDMKAAMRSGEKLRLETLRSLRAAMLDLQKSGKEVTPDDEMRAAMNQSKRRKDAIEQYRNANRPDLAEKEETEMAIIAEYLPKQLEPDAIRAKVREIIAETGAKSPADFKLVMPKAVAAMRGVADGSQIQAVVKEELEKAG